VKLPNVGDAAAKETPPVLLVPLVPVVTVPLAEVCPPLPPEPPIELAPERLKFTKLPPDTAPSSESFSILMTFPLIELR